MKYSVNMTIAKELAQSFQKMRPFSRCNAAGRDLHPVLCIDVAIKHVDVQFLSEPLQKKTKIDHQRGKVLIALPSEISGYHAHAILMSGRGLQMISRVAYEADFKEQGVCVPSPDSYAGYLYDLWACMQDFLRADFEIDASELLLKELRLTVISQTGRKIARFESMAAHAHRGLSLSCSDTGLTIDSEASLQEAISYRVKKAAVNSVAIIGIESRLREIYTFCQQETPSVGYERQVDRPMPNTISYASFAEAVRDVALSFELSESGAVVFGDVSNKQLMTRETLLETLVASSMESGADIQEECQRSAEGDTSKFENRESNAQQVNVASKSDSSLFKVDSSYILNRFRGAAIAIIAAPYLAVDRSKPQVVDSWFIWDKSRATQMRKAKHRPCASGFGVLRQTPGRLSHIDRQNRVIDMMPTGAKFTPSSDTFVGLTGVRTRHIGFCRPSIHERRQRPSNHKNQSGFFGRCNKPPGRRETSIMRKAPSPFATIQIVDNVCYLQFEYSKSGRGLMSRAPPRT